MLDSFPTVLMWCLAHSRSPIYLKKVITVGSKLSNYCFPYFPSTISAFLLLPTIHVGGMKLLRRDVISLVNIIATIYYQSTKVILIFSGLYTSPKLSLEEKFIMFVFVLRVKCCQVW